MALDPELLGKVFENLLGAYNPETEATARNATGSFYTPREIVDYMVEESLKNYLRGKLALPAADPRLDGLFDRAKTAAMEKTGFSREDEKRILEALYSCRIIDPACGSGAFPMGILNCMTRLIARLDDNGLATREFLFRRYQQDKERRDPAETEQDRKERLAELEKRYGEGKMYPDYARKLYLIENCIYGVDIQPIATQIAKLRFFISLLCDQFRNNYDEKCRDDNYGLLSLPNLEAKFVCANTLVALPDAGGELGLTTGKVGELRDELVHVRHKIFGARSTATKEKYKAADREKRREIREAVRDGLAKPDEGKIAQLEKMIAQAKERRLEVEKPDWGMVKKSVQQDFFAETSTQPKLIKVDRNVEKRAAIDREIDDAEDRIAKERAKGSKANVLAATRYADMVAGWGPFDQNASSPFFDAGWMFNVKDGFDIVIGNPPYIQLQKDGGELADLYADKGYETFNRRGDLYCLFYERGWQLLRNGGMLCYITSNKWMKAGYGEELRRFLAENTDPKVLIDFAGEQIFESATVDTNILLFEKGRQNGGKTRACIGSKDCRDNLTEYVRGNSFVCQFLPTEAWTVLSPIEQDIKRKIESVGKPLAEWDVNIYRGIVTGLNEAFIIDGEKRKEILGWCKSPAERRRTDKLIRPMLRGRDVKRYGYEWAGLYMICTFPALNLDIKDYPAIKKHLLTFGKERLEQSGKKIVIRGEKVSARSKTCYRWFEPQSAVGYWKDLEKSKLVWMDLSDVPAFAYDENGFSLNNMVYFLSGNVNLKYLVGCLNSRMAIWQFSQICSTSGVGTMRWQAFTMDRLRVPSSKVKEQMQIAKVVDRILSAKRRNPSADTSVLEHQIDALVYKLYGLSKNEIAVVEGRNTPNPAKSISTSKSTNRSHQTHTKSTQPIDDEILD